MHRGLQLPLIMPLADPNGPHMWSTSEIGTPGSYITAVISALY